MRPQTCTDRRLRGDTGNRAIYKPRRGAWVETNPADPWPWTSRLHNRETINSVAEATWPVGLLMRTNNYCPQMTQWTEPYAALHVTSNISYNELPCDCSLLQHNLLRPNLKATCYSLVEAFSLSQRRYVHHLAIGVISVRVKHAPRGTLELMRCESVHPYFAFS